MEVNSLLWKLAVKEQFENILEENDWFESDVLFWPTFYIRRK
jgi:hypothetical protein